MRQERSERGLGLRTYDTVTALVGGAIGFFSPRKACFYRYDREVLRSFVSGELTGPNQNWHPRSKSGDTDIKRGQKLITARARDMVKNNGYVAGAIEKICNNVVRRGITPQAKHKTPAGQPNKTLNKTIEKQWGRWSRYADIAGHNSYYAIQRLVLRHVWIDGEVLIHRTWDTSLRGIAPLRLEVIECDQLDTLVDGELANGNIGRRGIEVDPSTGRPVAYHVLDQHPGDYLFLGSLGRSRRLPAADIIHVFDKRRASQTRGVSWLAAILMEAYDLGEYKSIERIGAKLAAAFGIFVKSNTPDVQSGAGIGIPASQLGPNGKPDATTGTLPDYIDPGRIQRLPYGTDITVASHNRPGTQYEPFIRDSVRGMSTGTGMSYESFSNDYTAASYSSARSASLEERLSYQGQQFFLDEKLNDRVWAWFFEAAWLAGLLPEIRDYATDPAPYHEAVSWQDPGWTWVDPLKDSKAADTGLNNATTTRSKINAQCGDDWEDDVLAPLIYEEEQLTRLYELRRKNQVVAIGKPAATDGGQTDATDS